MPFVNFNIPFKPIFLWIYAELVPGKPFNALINKPESSTTTNRLKRRTWINPI